ncbi:MAG: flagellin, partial [Defluviitaleaceae bacterium]|nr:flagellin [Defluviitaleaceae bacterium]
INSAADDAAGLAISENMRAQIRGLDQASRNAQDGQSMLLTTEGGLEEIGNMLQRTRELLVQAANDTNTQDQRNLIQQEIGQLGREILSMQNRVEFNTNRVLAMGPMMTDTVLNTAAKMDISANNLSVLASQAEAARRDTQAAIDLLAELPSGATVTGAAKEAVAKANQLQDLVNFGTVIKGTGLDGVASTLAYITDAVKITTTGNAGVQLAAANERMGAIMSQIAKLETSRGGSIMRGAFNTAQTQVRTFVNASSSGNNVAFFQVGANASQGINFDFETVSRAVAGAGWTVSMLSSVTAAPGAGSGIGNGVRLSPYVAALDASINDVSSVRANLGAVQNRMDFTMRSLDISSENLQDSESRVRNADVAREMMRFTMSNVLQQASVSMLSQANQMPQNLLQLLR